MNNPVFRKTTENERKHRDIKHVTIGTRKSYLVLEPNYHTTKWFSENLLAIEMNETNLNMNKPVYLGMSILEIRKIAMYENWYYYAKPKYERKSKPCYLDPDSFIVHVKLKMFMQTFPKMLR